MDRHDSSQRPDPAKPAADAGQPLDMPGMPDEQREELLMDLADWLGDECVLFGMNPKDAEDATNEALEKLIEDWDTIKAVRGANSLKKWLERVALRWHLRRVAKERRHRMNSWQESGTSDGEGLMLEELEGDSGAPDFYDLTLVRDEDVHRVNQVMARMPEGCHLMKEHAMPPCRGTCDLLWNRYGREETKVTLEELADDLDVSVGKMYPWFKRCCARFKKLYGGHN